MKKIVALVTSVVMMLSCGITAYADDEPDYPVDDGIIEEYQYTFSIRNILEISGSTATCSCDVVGYHGTTTKVFISNTLQQNYGGAWYNIGYQYDTFYDFTGSLVTYEYNLAGGSYRLKSTAKVYSGSNYETITIYAY